MNPALSFSKCQTIGLAASSHANAGARIRCASSSANDFPPSRPPSLASSASPSSAAPPPLFGLRGDWNQGIARIRCPDCGYDLFRPFSCKNFFLCSSCAQKRTLLLGEDLGDDLLLCLPHRHGLILVSCFSKPSSPMRSSGPWYSFISSSSTSFVIAILCHLVEF